MTYWPAFPTEFPKSHTKVTYKLTMTPAGCDVSGHTRESLQLIPCSHEPSVASLLSLVLNVTAREPGVFAPCPYK